MELNCKELQDMFLSFNTNTQNNKICVYFNNEGRLFLLKKLYCILKEKDHEFFVLGSELQEYEYKEIHYNTCDFVNIFYNDNIEKEGIEVLISNKKSNLCAIALYLSSKTIEDLLCGLKKIDIYNGNFQAKIKYINTKDNISSMCIMSYILIL